MAHDLQPLIDQLTELSATTDPIQRAKMAGALADQAKSELAAARRDAIHTATRGRQWDEVSDELGISVYAINKAITAHQRYLSQRDGVPGIHR